LIKTLSASVLDLWLCFGDLNDTLSGDDKIGGNPRSFSQHYKKIAVYLRMPLATAVQFVGIGIIIPTNA
jgi:hypothetical protein